jgi:hypothetical protein
VDPGVDHAIDPLEGARKLAREGGHVSSALFGHGRDEPPFGEDLFIGGFLRTGKIPGPIPGPDDTKRREVMGQPVIHFEVMGRDGAALHLEAEDRPVGEDHEVRLRPGRYCV